MKAIPLTRGFEAIVDDGDHQELSQHKWYAERAGNSWRASRMVRMPDGTRQRVLMHRQIMGLSKEQRCDHKDLNELNNQRSNLRIANNSQNGANRKAWGRSRFKGVSWNCGCKHWIAYIRKDYKRTNLGCYGTEEEAAQAYDVAAETMHGEFARLNRDEQKTATR